jgi:hypothetical protein
MKTKTTIIPGSVKNGDEQNRPDTQPLTYNTYRNQPRSCNHIHFFHLSPKRTQHNPTQSNTINTKTLMTHIHPLPVKRVKSFTKVIVLGRNEEVVVYSQESLNGINSPRGFLFLIGVVCYDKETRRTMIFNLSFFLRILSIGNQN